MWVPNGWDLDDGLPNGAQEGLEKLMTGWHGLTVPEGNLTRACERAVLDSLDFGLLIGSSWSKGDSVEQILASLEDMQGSQDEKLLAAGVFLEAMEQTEEGIRIDARGGRQEREGSIVEVMEGASLTDAVHALWEDFGLAGLTSIGIDGDEAEIIWEQQLKKPKPLKTFLKGLDSSRKKAQQKAKFPYRIGELPGPVGAIHDLILTGLLEGPGIAERKATSRHDDIDGAAAGWAWLRAAERSTGQEWHFESLARDRGGAWMEATKALLVAGQGLLDSDDIDQEKFVEALRVLHTSTGQQESLPAQESA